MPTDPEEMMALLAKARPKNKRNPMAFERISQGSRHIVRAMRQNDGFMFDMALPLGRHFSTSFLWKFSNKKPSCFESSLQLVGGNPSPMADQDTTPFMAMMQNSDGSLMSQGQYPLPFGCIFNGMLQMDKSPT